MSSFDSSFAYGVLAVALFFATGCDQKPKSHARGVKLGASASAPASAVASAGSDSTPKATDPVRPLHRRTYSIVVDGELVHTGTTAGVVSWDYSNPKEPKSLADLVLAGNVQHLAALPSPSKLIVAATGPTGLALVDASKLQDKGLVLVNEHPWTPEQRGGCHSAWRFTPGAQGTGFLACGGAGVARVDLDDPAKAAVDAVVAVDGYVRDVALLDEQAGVPEACSVQEEGGGGSRVARCGHARLRWCQASNVGTGRRGGRSAWPCGS